MRSADATSKLETDNGRSHTDSGGRLRASGGLLYEQSRPFSRSARLADVPERERPRERLKRLGPKALSDLELVALVLGSGSRRHDVLAVADRMLELLDTNPKLSPKDLEALDGVGPAKAMSVCAALEFARRRIATYENRVQSPCDVLPLVRHFADRPQEHFLAVSLNGSNGVIATRVVSVGTVNRAQVHPRDVFADPVSDRAAAVIAAHNHPSGPAAPSPQDIGLTRRLQSAGKTLGIPLVDHVIFTATSYYSFKEQGRM